MKYSLITPRTRDKAPKILPKSETPTMPRMQAAAAEDTRAQMRGLSKLPGEQEIGSRICSIDGLDPLLLKCRRATHHREGPLVFAEYYRTDDEDTSYVYCAKDYENPDYTKPDGSLVPLDHPGATAIMRIEADRIPSEIHRW